MKVRRSSRQRGFPQAQRIDGSIIEADMTPAAGDGIVACEDITNCDQVRFAEFVRRDDRALALGRQLFWLLP